MVDMLMKDICIEQRDRPDIAAFIGEKLGAGGVNIEGLCLITRGETTLIHFAVEDATAAQRALENTGIEIGAVSDVFVLSKDQKRVTGKPGSFGEMCRALADRGVKVLFGYPAENNRFVFGVDNVNKAREVLE